VVANGVSAVSLLHLRSSQPNDLQLIIEQPKLEEIGKCPVTENLVGRMTRRKLGMKGGQAAQHTRVDPLRAPPKLQHLIGCGRARRRATL
jgi:hypothetical protein